MYLAAKKSIMRMIQISVVRQQDQNYLKAEEIPELFIACGGQDDLVGKGVKDFREKLKELEIPFIDRMGQGNHEMAYWEDQMDPVFSFLAEIEPGTKTRLILENHN